ncbi:Uncharacterised protein [Chlamydia trachomatis]|nr:Uncharacterised protein [Chlamydia trachomatis]
MHRRIGKALNRLLNERFDEAKKASEKGDFDLEETLIKSICGDFRVLLERSIENDLLWGVIQRFQRPVETLKIRYLANLREENISLLDSLMTKYSGFEHSQPVESPVELPKLDDLWDDMTALKTWREEYVKCV